MSPNDLPDEALVPMRWVRENFVVRGEEDRRLITTGQASAELGYSPDSWRGWAESKLIDGAFRDGGEGGAWRLPIRSCRDHIARLRGGKLNRRRKRGPWKAQAPAPQAGGAGSEGDPEGKVVELRPQSVGGRQAHDEGPEGGGLARQGRAHGRSGGR